MIIIIIKFFGIVTNILNFLNFLMILGHIHLNDLYLNLYIHQIHQEYIIYTLKENESC